MPGKRGGTGGFLLRYAGQQQIGRLVRLGFLGLGGLALLVSGLFGGLETVPGEDGLRTVAPGERIDNQPWAVTVTGAVLAPELPPAHLSGEENHFLVVVAEVEATAPESRGDLADILRVEGAPGVDPQEAPKDIVVMRDATLARSVHPGIPERLAFFWERTPQDEVPTEVTVVVHGKTYRESFLTRQMEWLDYGPRARVTVEVSDRRDALAE